MPKSGKVKVLKFRYRRIKINVRISGSSGRYCHEKNGNIWKRYNFWIFLP